MGYPDAIAYTGDRTFQSTIKPNFVVEDLNCHGHENNLKGLSMSFYPNFIQILSKILSKFYLDTMVTLVEPTAVLEEDWFELVDTSSSSKHSWGAAVRFASALCSSTAVLTTV